MHWGITLDQFPKPVKMLVFMFTLVMLFGYGISFYFLSYTTNLNPKGIEEQYRGNEGDEEAEEMKFEKSPYEMMATVHNHLFSLGVIFLLSGGLTFFTSIKTGLKKVLMIEPPASLIITFGSLLLMWNGLSFFKYIALISGVFMHLFFVLSLLVIIRQLFFFKQRA